MLVLSAIQGSDARDPSAVDKPFHWHCDVDLSQLKIGVLTDAEALSEFDGDVENEDHLKLLRDMGAKLEPIHITRPPAGIFIDLSVECAAAFDDFTLGDEIYELKNSRWPRTFRSHRYVTAVEYMQADADTHYQKASEVFPDPWHFRRYIESAVRLVAEGRVNVSAIAKTVAPCEEGPRILKKLLADASAYVGVALKWQPGAS